MSRIYSQVGQFNQAKAISEKITHELKSTPFLRVPIQRGDQVLPFIAAMGQDRPGNEHAARKAPGGGMKHLFFQFAQASAGAEHSNKSLM